MTNLINTIGISTTDIISEAKTGKFRFITKCRAGWLTIVDAKDHENELFLKQPEALLTSHKKGALHTIEFQPADADYWFTVFAKKGNKVVLMDTSILADLTVGTINQLWRNTNLYNQDQYDAVGATTWTSKAFIQKEPRLALETL